MGTSEPGRRRTRRLSDHDHVDRREPISHARSPLGGTSRYFNAPDPAFVPVADNLQRHWLEGVKLALTTNLLDGRMWSNGEGSGKQWNDLNRDVVANGCVVEWDEKLPCVCPDGSATVWLLLPALLAVASRGNGLARGRVAF